jgi:hypothetical protein
VGNRSVQEYLLWRRSLLLFVAIPGAIAALIHLINLLVDGFENFSAIGVFWQLGQLLSQVAIPVVALLAASAWANYHRSRRIIVVGWLVAFMLPMVLALTPANWIIDIDAVIDSQIRQQGYNPGDVPLELRDRARQQAEGTISILAGLAFFFALLPTVLSLIPGTLRACVRIKTLLPESIIPGWFLMIASPLYTLFTLVLFIAVAQAAGNLLLILGVLLLVGAPAVYIAHYKTFIRPIVDDVEKRKLDQLQLVYLAVVMAGIFFLVIYLLTVKITLPGLAQGEVQARPKSLIGDLIPLDDAAWNGFKLWINYLARAMFMTAAATDLFMLVNLSIWRNMKRFETTPQAAGYAELMSELGNLVFPGRPLMASDAQGLTVMAAQPVSPMQPPSPGFAPPPAPPPPSDGPPRQL